MAATAEESGEIDTAVELDVTKKENQEEEAFPSGDASREANVTSLPRSREHETAESVRHVDISSYGEKGKRIHFYRNGDRYFKGLIWGLSPQKFRIFESKLVELVNVPLKENSAETNMKYSFDKVSVVNSPDSLSQSSSHFLASKEFFNKIRTESTADDHSQPRLSAAPTKLSLASRERDRDHSKLMMDPGENNADTPMPTIVATQNVSPIPIISRTVVVIRNGCKPRRLVRFLLNQQTAHSYEEVLADMGDAVRSEVGTIKKVFGLDGVQVHTLADFFKEEVNTFIVYGPESPSSSDFELDTVERRWVSHKSRQIFHVSAVASARRRATVLKNVKERQISPLHEKSELEMQLEDGSNYDENSRLDQLDFPPPDFEKQSVVSGFWLSYQLGGLYSQSNVSTTHYCTRKSSPQSNLIVKVLELRKHANRSETDRELRALSQIKHDSLIRAQDQIFYAPDFAFIVVDNLHGYRLLDGVTEITRYSEVKVTAILEQLLPAVAHLHEELKIIHFNINHNSIMLTEVGKVLLGSFCKARSFEDCRNLPTQSYVEVKNSSSTYTAPEIVDGSKLLSYQCDMYSIAVLLLLLMTGDIGSANDIDSAKLLQLISVNGWSAAMSAFLFKIFGYAQPDDSITNGYVSVDRCSAVEAQRFMVANGEQWSMIDLDTKVLNGLENLAQSELSASTKIRVSCADLLFS